MTKPNSISWTDRTWNPIIGCSKVSPGCANCYAERMARRQTRMRPGCEYCDVIGPDGRWNGKTVLVESALEKPLHWRKPSMVFVCSMGDLFHPSVTNGMILRVMEVIAKCAFRHTVQILTKYPERMCEWFAKWADLTGEPLEPQLVRGPEETRRHHPSPRGQMYAEYLESMGTPPDGYCYPTFDWMDGMRGWSSDPTWVWPNLWLGVTAENQEQLDLRLPHLLRCPAAVRFVSIEPMLGPITFEGRWVEHGAAEIHENWLERLDWVICGGESGPGARPMHPGWVELLHAQCTACETPFHFKQWGEWRDVKGYARAGDVWITGNGEHQVPWALGTEGASPGRYAEFGDIVVRRVGKSAAGHLINGLEFRQFPASPISVRAACVRNTTIDGD